ncbi:MAG: tail fiber domain-containing protein [Saprospiraceae bacterium]|nr:tail fiber domain-containing protein [Saprospiraceae bacterium]
MVRKIVFMLVLPVTCVAQNTMEVSGAVGATVAIIGGDGAGISLQQNWPAIGFNEYNYGGPKSIAAGNGWVKYLDMNTGSLVLDQTSPALAANGNMSPTRRLTIRQNGNVSVNATEANASLFVGGANIGLPAAMFRGTNYTSTFYEQSGVDNTGRNTYINGGKPGSLVLLNDKLGGNIIIGSGTSKVGINTSTPTDILEVKQAGGRGLALINPNFAYWEFFVEKNLEENAGDLYVYYNGGNLGNFYQGDGKYYNYSDQRVKNNIQSLKNILPGVLALRPCTYEIKFDNPGHQQSIGLIAQEAREIFPEITGHIEGDDLGYGGIKDLYTMDYSALGPLAIKAIQEQQLKVDRLKAQVEALKQRIERAETQIKSSTGKSPTQ